MKTQAQIAVIVIPTYNEAGNISKMLNYLHQKTFPSVKNKIDGLVADWQIEVLVVDDNSPDGTGKIVENLSEKYPEVHLLAREKKTGLGSAYADGFRYAMDKLRADFVFEMDADFQHPPETLPSMLKAMEDGYDYVIGSRKIKGGAEPEGRDFLRIIMTEAGGFLARFILFFPFKYFWNVTDPTTGLKVTRVKGFVDKMDLRPEHFYSRKFGYKVQWLLETLDLGARFKEVPLKFANRESGSSKFESDTTTEILISCIKSRWFEPFVQKFLKFGTVGFVGYLVNAVLLFLVSKQWGIEWLSWALSTEAAIISNFTLNNIWTFRSDKISGVGQVAVKFFQFNLSSFGALLIQTIFGTLGVSIFGSQSRQILLPFIILFLVLPYNWLMYNKFIWKKK